MVTSIMKKRTIRERKKNRRPTIAVWITTCIATALFAAVFSFASSCQAGLIEYAKDLSGDYDYVFYDVPREEADHIVNCLLYTSDDADERTSVDLGGRRHIKKKKKTNRK